MASESYPPHSQHPVVPFVSVVVPVLDDATGIERTLEALLAQTYPTDRFEVLVTDNGSEDDSREVVERAAAASPGRVRLLTEFETRSSYAARNVGIRVARGTVLAFTDADCAPVQDWLEQGVRVLETEDAAYVAGHVEMTFRNRRPNVWELYDALSKMNQQRYMERYGFGATANLFVRRGCVDRHGAFRAGLESGGDYEFGRRLARGGERGVYAGGAVVQHPARATRRAILAKQRRILRGRVQLERLGLLEHGRLTWRSFVPVRQVPENRLRQIEDGIPALGSGQRVGLLVVANFVRYLMLLTRLGGRIGRLIHRDRRGAVGRADRDGA